ncbi:MAG: hypothetical protein KDK70_12825 [Myxococcales bacterium]|nr:hypothetical protein [Myxococcales bacterium]
MLTSMAVAAAAALGCWPAGPEIVALSGTGGSSSGSDPSSDSTHSTNSTHSTMTTSPSSTTATGTADGGSTSATTGATLATDSSSGGCPQGTEGCPCTDRGTCDLGLLCSGGTCELAPACRPIDPVPHDDENTAIELEMVNCSMSMDLEALGTIDGPQTDWYTFFGNDAFGCNEQPAAQVTADEPLRVCVYIECVNGGATGMLSCSPGTMGATSPEGRNGCCGSGGAMVGTYDCFLGSKDVDVYVSIGSDEAVCVDYGLTYSI